MVESAQGLPVSVQEMLCASYVPLAAAGASVTFPHAALLSDPATAPKRLQRQRVALHRMPLFCDVLTEERSTLMGTCMRRRILRVAVHHPHRGEVHAREVHARGIGHCMHAVGQPCVAAAVAQRAHAKGLSPLGLWFRCMQQRAHVSTSQHVTARHRDKGPPSRQLG